MASHPPRAAPVRKPETIKRSPPHCVQRQVHRNPKSMRVTKGANSGGFPSTTSRARQEAGNQQAIPPTAYNVIQNSGAMHLQLQSQ